jgi:predicted ATPase
LVVEICNKLDGIPLAIELAAGGVRTFGLREMAARLNGKLEALQHGRRTAPPRHRTFDATLDWSYHLLRDREQTVLRWLSVFSGDFTFEAARSIAGTDKEVEVATALAGLVAKSLVAVDMREETTHYRLLDTTRAYAAGKLVESGI